MKPPFKPPVTVADGPKPPRVSDHPLLGADDVLQPVPDSIRHLHKQGAPLWAGAHLANMSTYERRMLRLARDIVDEIAFNMQRRYEQTK